VLQDLGLWNGSQPETLTGGGGRHVLFSGSGDKGRAWNKKPNLGVELKALGQQVVLPPSSVAGHRYRWLTDWPDAPRAVAPLSVEALEQALADAQNDPELAEALRQQEAVSIVTASGTGSRNDTLNREAYGNALSTETALRQAGLAAGLDPEEVEATVRSATESAYPNLVRRRLTERFAKSEVEALYRRATEGARGPLETPTLREVLALPPEPPARVAGLIPSDAFSLIVAQAKTGKTTFVLNLVRSLLTGERFLGVFDVTPLVGSVAILNYEVSNRQLARWCTDVGLDEDRVMLVPLRGVGNPLSEPARQKELAGRLRSASVETLVVDPFSQAFTGADENATSEVGPFLKQLARFAFEEVGARDLVLVAHAGHDGERVRGNSRLLGDPDAVVTLTRDSEGQRYMSAVGRDVDVAEDRLQFDLSTRRMLKTGSGSRARVKQMAKLEHQVARQHGLLDKVVAAVRTEPGVSQAKLVMGIEGRAEDVITAAAEAAARGLIEIRGGGPGVAKRHYPTSSQPTLPN
jgi:hypothetical protein